MPGSLHQEVTRRFATRCHRFHNAFAMYSHYFWPLRFTRTFRFLRTSASYLGRTRLIIPIRTLVLSNYQITKFPNYQSPVLLVLAET